MNEPIEPAPPTVVASPPVLPIYLPLSEARARETYIRYGPAAALDIFVERAASGNPSAQAILGYMYLNRMLESDEYLVRSIYWAKRSAVQGDSYGAWVLSWAQFENGEWQDGMRSMLDAAEDEFPPALYSLGSFVGNGVILPKDIGKSVQLFRMAASHGFVGAASMLEAIDMTGVFGPYRRIRQTIMRPFNVISRLIYVFLFRPAHSEKGLIYPRFLQIENSLRRQFGEDVDDDLEHRLERMLARLQ